MLTILWVNIDIRPGLAHDYSEGVNGRGKEILDLCFLQENYGKFKTKAV